MAEPARLQILNLLRTAEHNVGELAELTGYSIANVSRHLSQLQRQAFVLRESRGNNAFTASPTRPSTNSATWSAARSPNALTPRPRKAPPSLALRTAAKTPRRTKAKAVRSSRQTARQGHHHLHASLSALEYEHGAINLGQGFPGTLRRRAPAALVGRGPGWPQPPADDWSACAAPGHREQDQRALRSNYDADCDITVTAGGTQSLYTSLQACVGAGDEALIPEPSYCATSPSIRAAGAVISACR